jgi:hypothetical protein
MGPYYTDSSHPLHSLLSSAERPKKRLIQNPAINFKLEVNAT